MLDEYGRVFKVLLDKMCRVEWDEERESVGNPWPSDNVVPKSQLTMEPRNAKDKYVALKWEKLCPVLLKFLF